jgi:hypothetical protein
MELKSDFEQFLKEIRPTENQRSELVTGHQTLRKRLNADEDLAPILVSDFLQGSYRRYTAVRPKSDQRSDVDIIVVTKLSEAEYTPKEAMALFEPFLKKHYEGRWRRQGRSFGIEMSYVELDLVLTSAPRESETDLLKAEAVTTDENIEEARDWRLHPSWLASSSRYQANAAQMLKEAASQDEWKLQPLRIPDRDAGEWDDTHPLEQIRWTRDKNKATNGHFVNVVKALKWWRLVNHEDPEHPKGFPLERIIGDCCPDSIESVAQGIVETLEAVEAKYCDFVKVDDKPRLGDYGVPAHDVLHRLESKDFGEFWKQAKDGAELARRAYDSTDRKESGLLWRELLGDKFPSPPDDDGGRGYTKPTAPAAPGSGRFA